MAFVERVTLFVKGGDYGLADLPEASLLAGWDGQVAIVPYLQGRSSNQLIEEVSRRGIR